MSDRLGTAQWENRDVVGERYPFAEGKFWLGRAEDGAPIGYSDDRHICLVSGNRGGKGTSIIVNNLCFWPGSAVVIDPKGEDATITAARRGQGSEHCEGMGQAVHVLDPFNDAYVDDRYRSSFNPLADLDPQNEETIDEANRIADALIVIDPESRDKFFDEAARSLLHGLILYIVTARHFLRDERNLIAVRDLIMRGEWQIAENLRAQGYKEDTIDDPHLLLWRKMENNPAFNGVLAGIGANFRTLMKRAEKTYEGVMQSLRLQTAFLDSPGMRRVLTRSNFKLSELKTRPEGMTLYLSLPTRYKNTHSGWLRMMIALTINQMEITRGQPASGHRVLMVLDEFKSLKRMTVIEDAVAQIAGFGVKLFFVLQSLEQLKDTYKDNWETFLANAGVKVFFSIEDNFTRDYVSKQIGDTEIIRELQNVNESESENESEAMGTSQSETLSRSATRGTSRSASRSQTEGESYSETEGTSDSHSVSESFGTNQSQSWSRGSSGGTSTSFGPNGSSTTFSRGDNSSVSGSDGTSHSTTHGSTHGTSHSTTKGKSISFTDGITDGTSESDTLGTSDTGGTSQTRTFGTSRTAGRGRNESIHRRPLIQPEEVGRHFARIDDRTHPWYPGLALVLVTGANPLMVRRTHYFQDLLFIDCFSPHPDHKFIPPVRHTLGMDHKFIPVVAEGRPKPKPMGIQDLVNVLEAYMNYDTLPDGRIVLKGDRFRQLTISRWLIEVGSVVEPGQAFARIDCVPPDNRTVHIFVPRSGKVSEIAADKTIFSATEYSSEDGGRTYLRPEGVLFTVKNYSDSDQTAVDPFYEIWQACCAVVERKRQEHLAKMRPQVLPAPVFHAPARLPPPTLAPPPEPNALLAWIYEHETLALWLFLAIGTAIVVFIFHLFPRLYEFLHKLLDWPG